MKTAIVIITLIIPAIAGATEINAEDLTALTNNMSQIVSFFAGCLAIIAFIGGINGGRMR